VIGFLPETVYAFRQPSQVVADLVIASDRYADRKIRQGSLRFRFRVADRSTFLVSHYLVPLIPVFELVIWHVNELRWTRTAEKQVP
jgi:hypothetical protein